MLRSISSWTLPIPVPFKGRRRRRGLAWQVDRETKAGHVTFSNERKARVVGITHMKMNTCKH
jgi:hypothetical protein